MAPIYACQFYLSNNQHIASSIQVYLQCTYLFPHCSFLWISSISAHQVPTILQVPIQATQHKDDTNPLCISFVLFKVLYHYYFLRMFLHPSTPSANSTMSTNPSYPTQGRYPSLGVSPSCATQGALPLFISLDVLQPGTPSADSTPSTDSSHPTQGRYPSLGVSSFCSLQGASPC